MFVADREHIHHKLLQRGLSHRQVVIVLYAVSAVFALLSLFLLWPGGSTLGLVLAVIGTGVWFGVQHLGYLEFWELRRVARRTVEQRRIFVNNLAIRRATEALKRTSDYAQICRILESAFTSNDFDGFTLIVKMGREHGNSRGKGQAVGAEEISFEWSKPGAKQFQSVWSSWNVGLDLVSSNNELCGSLKIYRFYNNRDLLVDTNLLTLDFPIILADALERTLGSELVVREVKTSTDVMAAEAG